MGRVGGYTLCSSWFGVEDLLNVESFVIRVSILEEFIKVSCHDGLVLDMSLEPINNQRLQVLSILENISL